MERMIEGILFSTCPRCATPIRNEHREIHEDWHTLQGAAMQALLKEIETLRSAISEHNKIIKRLVARFLEEAP